MAGKPQVVSPNKPMPLKNAAGKPKPTSTGGAYKGPFKKVSTKAAPTMPVSTARKGFLKSGQRNGSPTKAQTF